MASGLPNRSFPAARWLDTPPAQNMVTSLGIAAVGALVAPLTSACFTLDLGHNLNPGASHAGHRRPVPFLGPSC